MRFLLGFNPIANTGLLSELSHLANEFDLTTLWYKSVTFFIVSIVETKQSNHGRD